MITTAKSIMTATKNTSRTRIYLDPDGSGDVVVHRWDGDSMVTTNYYVAGDHGYVRTRRGDGQVCEGLYSMGRTLECSRSDLLRVIRREHKRRMRDERAERASTPTIKASCAR